MRAAASSRSCSPAGWALADWLRSAPSFGMSDRHPAFFTGGGAVLADA